MWSQQLALLLCVSDFSRHANISRLSCQTHLLHSNLKIAFYLVTAELILIWSLFYSEQSTKSFLTIHSVLGLVRDRREADYLSPPSRCLKSRQLTVKRPPTINYYLLWSCLWICSEKRAQGELEELEKKKKSLFQQIQTAVQAFKNYLHTDV